MAGETAPWRGGKVNYPRPNTWASINRRASELVSRGRRNQIHRPLLTRFRFRLFLFSSSSRDVFFPQAATTKRCRNQLTTRNQKRQLFFLLPFRSRLSISLNAGSPFWLHHRFKKFPRVFNFSGSVENLRESLDNRSPIRRVQFCPYKKSMRHENRLPAGQNSDFLGHS